MTGFLQKPVPSGSYTEYLTRAEMKKEIITGVTGFFGGALA